MDVFEFRDRLIADYAAYTKSFVEIADDRIRGVVNRAISEGRLWPEPLIQLNPAFEPGGTIGELTGRGLLHPLCEKIFRIKKEEPPGIPIRLHRHQTEAIEAASSGGNYVLTTGTGSGKSLTYIIPIVDHVLRNGTGRGIQAIVIYPMNALANSQKQELEKFLHLGFEGKPPVSFALYTGQEEDAERQRIQSNPPDILLTNFVMLEYVMTRPIDKKLIDAARGLRYLVLDELHTYRGRQGADVAMLVRRVRERIGGEKLQCVGTSATMASEGSTEDRRREVARVATKLFGAEVKPEHVIGETLRRVTEPDRPDDPSFLKVLRGRIAAAQSAFTLDGTSIRTDPLASWIESCFGVVPENGTGRLVRQTPRSIRGDDGAAALLERLTGEPRDRCESAIRHALMAGYVSEDPATGFPSFAFRLHQFLSPGDRVYASPEREDIRHVTLDGQQFVPGSRDRVLLPVVFCRECGQDYYLVSRIDGDDSSRFVERDLLDIPRDEGPIPGFLFINTREPWPDDEAAQLERVPEDWLEERAGSLRVSSARRDYLPRKTSLLPSARIGQGGLDTWFLEAPFTLCLRCGVHYEATTRSDYGKLYSLGFEGRATATTLLCLSSIRVLKKTTTIEDSARKLLSFTDNRQDAALQAGHFNDFVQVGLVRGALLKAVHLAGATGLRHDQLPDAVFDALGLEVELYADDPTVRFAAATETQRALKDVLAYRVYRDLQQGWRVTAPNLEQCGLLRVDYQSLSELCAAEDVWRPLHPALATASPAKRESITRVLLDHLRRSLAIRVDSLDREKQFQLASRSRQHLNAVWRIDDGETLTYATHVFPRSIRQGEWRGQIYLSARSTFGRFLRKSTTFEKPPKTEDCARIIVDLFSALKVAGLLAETVPSAKKDDPAGYQIPASALLWKPSEGKSAYQDVLRVPRAPERGLRTNPFFVNFYRTEVLEAKGFEAREHTAQVRREDRVERENRFRAGHLPILFCSPTMELGVDIRDLNAVNMRNVPPTAANYAQRSGRAGRQGQPALVFTYCSRGNSHDQYFFQRPERMVKGIVEPPRLDLANEDLVRAHVYAIWLSETGASLGSTLKDILDLSGESAALPILESVMADLETPGAAERAHERASKIFASLDDELREAPWFTPEWLKKSALGKVLKEFDRSCDRWRGLYRAALSTRDEQHKVIGDASRSARDKEEAKRLRAEAETQLHLLTEGDRVQQSDFYSYRYFASEGFLPGYNFPRLPLSAFIPGRRVAGKRTDDFVSRPRFLAISEFGPRAIVYHEGARYLINRVLFQVDEDGPSLLRAKICSTCGCYHTQLKDGGHDVCEGCGGELGAALHSLFRMRNVATRRKDRISSDEEERLRLGFEILTAFRFQQHGARTSRKVADVVRNGEPLARLEYGHAMDLFRVNLGWRRRKIAAQVGFELDIERGYWAKSETDAEPDADDPMSQRRKRVIPFVEDRRNGLLFDPIDLPGELSAIMPSLQAALATAIRATFQLEDSELAAEPLPSDKDRRRILLFESAEGGAGVLRRLVEDPSTLRRVGRAALEICHFDPETGEDRKRSPRRREDCEAACYDCLMSYSNQRDHQSLDRKAIREALLALAAAEVKTSPGEISRDAHVEYLKARSSSGLEREWIDFVHDGGLALPDDAQVLITDAHTRPDFVYKSGFAAVYVDGPPHDYPDRHKRDRDRHEQLENLGYTVIRFHHRADWTAIAKRHPGIFGETRPEGPD